MNVSVGENQLYNAKIRLSKLSLEYLKTIVNYWSNFHYKFGNTGNAHQLEYRVAHESENIYTKGVTSGKIATKLYTK